MDWHPEDIKAAVRKTGISLSELGRRIGRDRRLMAKALRLPDPKAERAIATRIGVAPALIWPSRYHLSGRRRSPQPVANYYGGVPTESATAPLSRPVHNLSTPTGGKPSRRETAESR